PDGWGPRIRVAACRARPPAAFRRGASEGCRGGTRRRVTSHRAEVAAEAAPTGVGGLLEVVVHHRAGHGEEVALDVVHARGEQDRHAGRVLHVLGNGADAHFPRALGDLAHLGLVVLVT